MCVHVCVRVRERVLERYYLAPFPTLFLTVPMSHIRIPGFKPIRDNLHLCL